MFNIYIIPRLNSRIPQASKNILFGDVVLMLLIIVAWLILMKQQSGSVWLSLGLIITSTS